MDSQWSKQEACFANATQVFDVRSELHGQVSLAAVNQIVSFMLQNSKDSLKACFENVNILNVSEKLPVNHIHLT